MTSDPCRRVGLADRIQTVLVNGVVTVEAGQHTGARAGQMVRRTGAR
ncbi:MAG TPA: hypothetical protein VF464_00975 [Candidatus Methylomirabilis sp.]